MENHAGQPDHTGVLLKGAVALITGGSRGIGLAIARRLGDLSASLALCSRSAEHLQAAAKDLAGSGLKSLPVVADVTRAVDVCALVEHVGVQLGPVDILVNC